jgi:N-acetylglucosaminyl-diphospho-decaprenol L-rhamnosyltransferase
VKLSVIFVNWNALDYLRECIASIRENTHDISYEIIVVDNASPQGGIDTLGQQFPEIQIVKSSENLGFSRANNLGFRNSSGEFLLFLNPDIKLVNSAIQIMLESIQSLPDAGVVGCKLLNSDLTVQTSAIQKFPTILNQILDVEFFRLRWPDFRLWEIGPLFSKNGPPIPVEMISGACLLIRREVFKQVGGFSEDYFMYAEDIDLNHRVMGAGFRNYYVGQAVMIHYGGRSSTQQKVGQWATIMKYRGMQKFYTNTRGRVYAGVYRAAIGSAALGRLLVLALVFPFAAIVGDKRPIQYALGKWAAVLKWAVGLDRWVLGSGS